MKTFLEYVAEDILSKYGTDLSHLTVVFPNKRASLFLNEHLARLAGRPIWSPQYITISDLFRQYSVRTVADPIKLVCDLHKSFVSQTAIDETLDHFYGWGQLLLADFDDLDKNMADADKVFANLRDIHELDDVSYLSEEQKEAIRRFFSNFSDDHNSLLKERFISLWSHISDIYHDFNQRLQQQQLAYEGALYREVAEHIETLRSAQGELQQSYLFVGFNLLQRVEQRLFAALKKEGCAHFYWDFDQYYMKGHEAGHYIGQYLADFPNELDPTDAAVYSNFSAPKSVSYISAPTENIQARYVSSWLRENGRVAAGRRTAIVLCNERLLPTVVHCLPEEVEKVNVTTGFPLAQSPVASLIAQLIALQTVGYSAQKGRFRLHHVNAVLRHPYIGSLSPEVPVLLRQLGQQKIYYPSAQQLGVDESCQLLFRQLEGGVFNLQLLRWLSDVVQLVARSAESADPLFQESVFRAYTLLNRLHGLVDSGDLQVDTVTLQRLIGQLVQSTSIPFHGEPAEGLQVMGVLETRNLDFDHVLLLSCNEGNMPRGVNDTSFIPYNIRKAYGLTTIDHKVAIYSYYFHRLLQRASDVTVVYSNATTDGQTGEMSRFLLQLMVESPHAISFKTLQAGQTHYPFAPQPIAKTAAMLEKLKTRFARLLSPTAVNVYMRCPLRFYYQYVCDLKEPDVSDEDTIDNRVFGNIFHEASHKLYKRLMAKSPQILASDLDQLLRQRVAIEQAVDEAFRQELFHQPHAALPDLNGLQIINREVIIHYLRQLLQLDRQLAPFTIIGLETDVTGQIEVRSGRERLSLTVGGRIDRLDMVSENGLPRIRVIDYKTGNQRLKPLADVEAVFLQESLASHSDYYLQTLLYACLVKNSHAGTAVSPALLFIQHSGGDGYDPTLCFGTPSSAVPINDVADVRQSFMQLFTDQVSAIFDPDVHFVPTDDRARCRSCAFKDLCRLSVLHPNNA